MAAQDRSNVASINPDTGLYEVSGTLSSGNATISGMLAGDDAEVAVGTLTMTGGDYVFSNPIWIDRNGDGEIQGSIFSTNTTTGGEVLMDDGTPVGAGVTIDDSFSSAENEIYYAGDASLNGTVNETGGFILDRDD